MKISEVNPVMRRLRQGPLHDFAAAAPLNVGPEAVERILPHRDPFRFVDRLVSVDRAAATLLAERDIPAHENVFRGHFPGRPLFPAALQLEAIGQACLCLWGVLHGSDAPSQGFVVTKVNHGQFLNPVLPGTVMTLQATILYSDDLIISAAGQSWTGDTLCAGVIVEVNIIDD